MPEGIPRCTTSLRSSAVRRGEVGRFLSPATVHQDPRAGDVFGVRQDIQARPAMVRTQVVDAHGLTLSGDRNRTEAQKLMRTSGCPSQSQHLIDDLRPAGTRCTVPLVLIGDDQRVRGPVIHQLHGLSEFPVCRTQDQERIRLCDRAVHTRAEHGSPEADTSDGADQQEDQRSAQHSTENCTTTAHAFPCRAHEASTECRYLETMRVIVTGGAGYIGSHTCVRLLEEGHDVAVLDNFENSQPESLQRVQDIAGRDLSIHRGDVRDTGSFADFFDVWRPEAVIHFAGLKSVGESVAEPERYYTTNVQGTVNVAQAAVKAGASSFVFSSSATVYSPEAQMPVDEAAELRPGNPYGWSKWMAEQVLTDVQAAQPQLSMALLRYFNPVGAHPSGRLGEDPRGVPANLMPYMARVADGTYPALKVFGDDYPTPDGTGVRDYVHVVDLADAHLAALEAVGASSGVLTWNVGRGTGISVLEMVEAFERVTGREIPIERVDRRAGDSATSFAEVSEISRRSPWRAIRGVDEMVRDLWQWQSMNPEGYATGITNEAFKS